MPVEKRITVSSSVDFSGLVREEEHSLAVCGCLQPRVEQHVPLAAHGMEKLLSENFLPTSL